MKQGMGDEVGDLQRNFAASKTLRKKRRRYNCSVRRQPASFTFQAVRDILPAPPATQPASSGGLFLGLKLRKSASTTLLGQHADSPPAWLRWHLLGGQEYPSICQVQCGRMEQLANKSGSPVFGSFTFLLVLSLSHSNPPPPPPPAPPSLT